MEGNIFKGTADIAKELLKNMEATNFAQASNKLEEATENLKKLLEKTSCLLYKLWNSRILPYDLHSVKFEAKRGNKGDVEIEILESILGKEDVERILAFYRELTKYYTKQDPLEKEGTSLQIKYTTNLDSLILRVIIKRDDTEETYALKFENHKRCYLKISKGVQKIMYNFPDDIKKMLASTNKESLKKEGKSTPNTHGIILILLASYITLLIGKRSQQGIIKISEGVNRVSGELLESLDKLLQGL